MWQAGVRCPGPVSGMHQAQAEAEAEGWCVMTREELIAGVATPRLILRSR